MFSSDNIESRDSNLEKKDYQKTRKFPLKENSLYLIGEKKKPYYYYTVSELKSLLKERKLIVSGTQDFLYFFYDECNAMQFNAMQCTEKYGMIDVSKRGYKGAINLF